MPEGQSIVHYSEIFDRDPDAIAVFDSTNKILWCNKNFRDFFKGIKLKGKNVFTLLKIEDYEVKDKTVFSSAINKNVSVYPLGKTGEDIKSIARISSLEGSNGGELLQSNLLFQKELQNILSLILKEKSLDIVAEEILMRSVNLSKGNFGLVVLHKRNGVNTFINYDPNNYILNKDIIQRELTANFSFISKWFKVNNKSLEALNSSDNIGYNLTNIFQSHSLILSPCYFDDNLLATIVIGNVNAQFSPLEINNIEQFAAILSFTISTITTRELNTALENRLLQAQKLETIGKLSSGMAHDFSNLLSSIFGSLNLLKRKVTQKEDILRLLDNIENCSIRAKDLTKGLLSFGKPTPKRKELVKPNVLLGEISKVITQTFPKKIRFTSEIQDDLYDILGNGTEIYQILLNLCVNAKEAISEGGEITLSGKNIIINEANAIQYPMLSIGNYVQLSVRDNGSGIAEENIQKIFDPYFSTKEKETGSGLGLYVSYGIIKAHQGHIEVSSVINQGTSFDVFIPAFEKVMLVEKSQTSQEKIILLVDDELMLRDLLAELLESNSYNVIKVSSGIEALTVLTEEIKVDLMIIDYNMPEMNGLDCIRKVRDLEFKMPIILSSGSLNLDEKFNMKQIGIDYLLPKPYEFDTMLTTIKNLI